ncbi:MAG: hypothetical protein GX817_05610 [Elusimicrobia bacterium]|nr:hypothetical protein [Elusimicrobiota bacterium]
MADNILKVLIICAPDRSAESSIVSDIESVLRERFKSRLLTVTKVKELGSAFYSLMPHFVVFDSSYRKVLERLDSRYEFLKLIKERPFLIIRTPELTDEVIRGLEIKEVTFIPQIASKDEIEDALCAMAEIAGFPVKRGKIFERLVQRQLQLDITIPSREFSFSALTTGINKNGFGARLRAPGHVFEDLTLLAGESCRVSFNDPELMFMPVDAKIIRVLRSLEPDYEAFVACGFDPNRLYFDQQELRLLEKLIKDQKDESVMKQRTPETE